MRDVFSIEVDRTCEKNGLQVILHSPNDSITFYSCTHFNTQYTSIQSQIYVAEHMSNAP